jgi:arsenate reductase
VTTLYGIKNCDTVKKARRWLESRHIDYRFYDFRADGLDLEQIKSWVEELGWEVLVNRRSTSWKSLSPEQRDTMDKTAAITAILENPTLIKRPLLDTGSERHVGFNDNFYMKLFAHHTL